MVVAPFTRAELPAADAILFPLPVVSLRVRAAGCGANADGTNAVPHSGARWQALRGGRQE